MPRKASTIIRIWAGVVTRGPFAADSFPGSPLPLSIATLDSSPELTYHIDAQYIVELQLAYGNEIVES